MTKKVVLEEEVPVALIKMEKKRKRKADERSETVSEIGKSSNLKSSEAEKKNKKAKVAGEDEDENEVTKFSISAPLREKLEANGIKLLLPIQATTFEQILNGYDLVCRARTGQEKTLAFVLPILESLTNGHVKGIGYKNRGYGRPPHVLVLSPTRKRASKVFDVFKVYGGSLGLASCYACRAASCTNQEQYLKRGVDVVVGTPGRVKDLLEKGSLNLSSLKFRVLDEADQMLRMGFAKDVELILVKAGVRKVQTLLFSATFPIWVRKLSYEFPNPLKMSRDFVGYEKIAKAVGEAAAQAIVDVSGTVVSAFKSAAEDQLITSGLSSVELLAKARATTSGYKDIKRRSLLTSMEGHVTVFLEAERRFYLKSHAYVALRRFLPEEKVKSVKGMSLTADRIGAVFDVAAADRDTFLTAAADWKGAFFDVAAADLDTLPTATAGQQNMPYVRLEVLEALPPLQEKEQQPRRRFGGGQVRDKW